MPGHSRRLPPSVRNHVAISSYVLVDKNDNDNNHNINFIPPLGDASMDGIKWLIINNTTILIVILIVI